MVILTKFQDLIPVMVLVLTLIIGQIGLNFGQDALTEAYRDLRPGGSLPEDLLKTRTAVFLKVPVQPDREHPHHWRNLGHRLQQSLVNLNIDAVAYYLWQDLTAGRDATMAFMNGLSGREINQVILLENQNDTFYLSIIETDDSPGFIDTGQPVWQISGADFEALLENLEGIISRQDLELANFLVVETPEFFTDTRIFRENRFESFHPDLKLDKLAVPLEGADTPDSLQNPLNLKMRAQLQEYPFEYDFVNYKLGEQILINGGFHHLLLYLYGPESSIRRLLDYPGDQGDQGRMVYKFYTRHIRSGDIYLGDQWDASSDFEQSLKNHISNLKSALNVE